MDGEDGAVLRVAVLYPDLLGTYGDGGNALVLAARARARGIDLDVLEVTIGASIPSADALFVGWGRGRSPAPGVRPVERRRVSSNASTRAPTFSPCARDCRSSGRVSVSRVTRRTLDSGLVEVTTTRGPSRSVGDLGTEVRGRTMVGFENHGGVTVLGEGVEAFGDVVVGRGNDGRVDGYRTPRVIATYAHGPVLAQNPWLADELLSEISGQELSSLAECG